jgi:hypothetical protein
METRQILHLYHPSLDVIPEAPHSSLHIRYQDSQIVTEIQTSFPPYSFLFNLDAVSKILIVSFHKHKNISYIYNNILKFISMITKCKQYSYICLFQIPCQGNHILEQYWSECGTCLKFKK